LLAKRVNETGRNGLGEHLVTGIRADHGASFHRPLSRDSFWRFCGFAAHEATPERTAFVRFRKALVENGLDRSLFEEIVRQL
jgi:hypothetical protein